MLRRISVASYEVELNLVIHSMGGTLTLAVDPAAGDADARRTWARAFPTLTRAMTEGYSTANEEARSLGFGAGMGLPNMKRNASTFDIQSQPGVGTSIVMGFKLK